jgi:hypothetical protein
VVIGTEFKLTTLVVIGTEFKFTTLVVIGTEFKLTTLVVITPPEPTIYHTRGEHANHYTTRTHDIPHSMRAR